MGTFQSGGYTDVAGYLEEDPAVDAPVRHREDGTCEMQRHVSLVAPTPVGEPIKIPCSTAVRGAFWEMSGG